MTPQGLSAERLAEIEARLAAATPGPWAVNPMMAQVDAFATGEPLPVCQLLWPTDERTEDETEANAILIAHAPTDISDLHREVTRLRALADGMAGASQTLAKRCAEILDWSDTGLLNGGKGGMLRDFAGGLDGIPERDRLTLAESITKKEAMRLVVKLFSTYDSDKEGK